MQDFNYESAKSQRLVDWSTQKKNFICKTGNIILSIIYLSGSWVFSFFGLIMFTMGVLGSSDSFLEIVFYFTASVLFLLIPLFAVLGIVFSVILRKRGAFLSSFLIQFLPFSILGFAVIAFLLSII